MNAGAAGGDTPAARRPTPRRITLGATGIAELCVRPFAGWITGGSDS